jgi:hypothetical protein
MTVRVARHQIFLRALVPQSTRATSSPRAFAEIWSSNELPSKLSLLTSNFSFRLYSASPQIGQIQPISPFSAALLSLQLVDQRYSFSLGVTRRISSRPPVVTAKSSDRPVLVRNFILDSLYNPNHGYFASQAAVVGKIPKAIEFGQLWGKAGYTKLLNKLYKEIGSSWLTPVELFQPWYGYAIAEFIRQSSVKSQVPDLVAAKTEKSWLGRKIGKRKTGSHREAQAFGQGSGPLRIYEIGGGCGTCALNVLDYFEQKAPEIYKRIRYTSVEISKSLAAEQRRTVSVLLSTFFSRLVCEVAIEVCFPHCQRLGQVVKNSDEITSHKYNNHNAHRSVELLEPLCISKIVVCCALSRPFRKSGEVFAIGSGGAHTKWVMEICVEC